MNLVYQSTRDLRQRFRWSSRTIFRKMKRKNNPFPPPCIKEYGSYNLWDAEQFAAWEQREREKTSRGMAQDSASSAA